MLEDVAFMTIQKVLIYCIIVKKITKLVHFFFHNYELLDWIRVIFNLRRCGGL